MAQRSYDLLLMDLNYTRDTTSGREGLDLLERVRTKDSALPVVVMTGWGSIETAVEAMRRGARSFVQKPWDNTVLVEVVAREIADGQAARRRDARFSRDYEEARQIQRALLPRPCPRCGVPDCRAMDTGCEHRRRLLRRVAIQRYARGVVDCRCRGQRAARRRCSCRTCKPRSARLPPLRPRPTKSAAR